MTNGTDQGLAAVRISKRYGKLSILKDLSLEVPHGETLLLLGQNGSGKSTLLRILAGLLAPDSGSISTSAFPICGYMSHDPSLYGNMTLTENLRFFSGISKGGELASSIDEWGLSRFQSSFPKDLSRGQLARAALARACLGSPDILLLDEPTAFLDGEGISLLTSAIKKRAGNKTTIIATHDLERIGILASRMVLLVEGGILEDSQTSSVQTTEAAYRRNNR